MVFKQKNITIGILEQKRLKKDIIPNIKIPFNNGRLNPLNISKKLLFSTLLYIIVYVVKKLINAVIDQAKAIASMEPLTTAANTKPVIVTIVFINPTPNK